MGAFVYRAVDPSGRVQRGIIDADSPRQARQVLRDRRLLPLSVDGAATRGNGAKNVRGRLSASELAFATRQLATLSEGGVRVEDALHIVASQAGSPSVSAVLLDVRARILTGQSVASALGGQADSFPEFYRASVAAGEQSGMLGPVLLHLAAHVEKGRKTARKIQFALLYPALLTAVSAIIITVLLVYVVPDIVRVFVTRGHQLPFLTRALIALSHAVAQWGLAFAVAVAVAVLALRRWLASSRNQLALDRRLLRTPPFASFIRLYNASLFAGTLAMLIESRVPLMDSLNAVARVIPNRYIRAQIGQATERVREGASLRAALDEAGCFPPLLVAMVGSGEASGRLGPALSRVAVEQEQVVDARITALVALIEPAVLLVMGGIVALLVMAILLPIVGLNNLAGR
jgi:general secretion pathway protein F